MQHCFRSYWGMQQTVLKYTSTLVFTL